MFGRIEWNAISSTLIPYEWIIKPLSCPRSRHHNYIHHIYIYVYYIYIYISYLHNPYLNYLIWKNSMIYLSSINNPIIDIILYRPHHKNPPASRFCVLPQRSLASRPPSLALRPCGVVAGARSHGLWNQAPYRDRIHGDRYVCIHIYIYRRYIYI